ncbi:MAG: dihydrofolate reductase [Gammaproteobacteria bacterium]|nr:dihydrofolate reductase [Gammaproteobacteria bacterium]
MPGRAPRLTLIVAVADNGVIGLEGGLPWKLSEDLRRFKQRTLGRPVVMGRKTWESFGRPLPGRTNIVVTRRTGYTVDSPGVIVVRNLDSAIEAAGEVEEIMIIGGAEIYALALPRAELVELTRVYATVEGDTLFPAMPPEDWQEIACTEYPADERNQYSMSFVTLQRRGFS